MQASANSGVYAITHNVSGKRYVGFSRNKGCKMPPFTDEHRLKMSIAAKARKAREKAAQGI